MLSYFYLFGAIAFEVLGTMLLPVSKNFTKVIPSLVITLSYFISFYFASNALKTLPLAIVYASWSGLGVFTVAILSYVFYNQTINWQIIIGLFFRPLGNVIYILPPLCITDKQLEKSYKIIFEILSDL